MTERALVAFSGLDAAHQVAVRHVYESSFPLALRAPWEEIAAGRPDERLLVLLDAGEPVGFALIRHLGDTAMSFVRYPNGIDWNGNQVRFVVGIAGAGNDHLTLLSKLATVFLDEAQVARLEAATSQDEIQEILASVSA